MTNETNKTQSNGRTLQENSDRLLVVLYAMSGGKAGIPLRTEDIMAECDRIRLFEMTDLEFKEYRQKSINDAHALDAEFIG